ncbi:UNVERIFIED_CONTAM: hypothetical protein O8I53_11870 [Campylobacter lari]
MNKRSFYEPIKEYLDYLENYDVYSQLRGQKLLSNEEVNFINNIKTFADDVRFVDASKLLPHLIINNELISENIFEKILTFPNDIEYPQIFNFKNKKKMTKYLLKINNVRFKILNKKNYKIKKLVKKHFEFLNSFEGNLNNLVSKISNFKKDDYEYIELLLNLIVKNEHAQISDEKLLKEFIARNIIEKINKFDADTQALYTEFAATVRLSSLEPYKFIKRFAELIKVLFPIIIVTPDIDLSA